MMKKEFVMLYIIFRDLAMLVTFGLALYLERAVGSRFRLMVFLFTLLFIWLHIRELIMIRIEGVLPYTYAIDVLLLVFLDSSSKYLVNHYFNVYYFFVLIAAGFMLRGKRRLFTSFAIIIAAFIKYANFFESIFSGNPPSNITFIVSYIFFTFMVFVTVGVFFNYSGILSEQKEKLNKINRELTMANSMLEEKSKRIKELTIFEERNRIAQEIHDSVGHNLTGLIMNLDFCKKIAESNPSTAVEYIGKSRQIAKECLEDIRKSVKALKNVGLEKHTLIKYIEELAENSREKFNLEVLLDVQGKAYRTQPEFNLAVYRACQEAITNSVRHGKADKIEIRMNFGTEYFSVNIRDNGIGCEKLELGTGLNGMRERFVTYNGEIEFCQKEGFIINISVPVGEIIDE